ncbi:FGGY-family carbohydrate kinase [Anthocerotibacter panamensis]|uniref:FGGY-family carbohydrate kinase n=1 Tax=Anthocerotibacter panamensis TaxID=2857077 RepID=UPI0036F254A7
MTYAYLGLDFGTSGARAVVIDEATQVRAEARCTFTATSPENEAAVWQEVLFDLLGQIPVGIRREIRSIALDGTSATVLLCDASGHPLHPPLRYNDARAVAQVEWLRPYAPPGHVVLSPTSSLAKLLWLGATQTLPPSGYFLHQADWLAFLLHGCLGFSDEHNSLKLGYDVGNGRYPDWLVAPPFQALTPLLPRILLPGTPVNHIQPAMAQRFNFDPECQVCAGTTDSIAAFLASGVTLPGEAVTSLGSTLVLKLLSQKRVDEARYGIYSHRLGDLWLVGGASNAGAAVLQRFFSAMQLETLSLQIAADQESPLDYYPLLRPGERFPVADPALQPRLKPQPSDPVAFLHGLLESLARIEAQGYQRLMELGATPLQRVYTAGGGAVNQVWTQIRARHLGVPMAQPAQTEAAYGAALLALWGPAHRVENPVQDRRL